MSDKNAPSNPAMATGIQKKRNIKTSFSLADGHHHSVQQMGIKNNQEQQQIKNIQSSRWESRWA
jgi:hypothetical protein